jgi:hypothetical protein
VDGTGSLDQALKKVDECIKLLETTKPDALTDDQVKTFALMYHSIANCLFKDSYTSEKEGFKKKEIDPAKFVALWEK